VTILTVEVAVEEEVVHQNQNLIVLQLAKSLKLPEQGIVSLK